MSQNNNLSIDEILREAQDVLDSIESRSDKSGGNSARTADEDGVKTYIPAKSPAKQNNTDEEEVKTYKKGSANASALKKSTPGEVTDKTNVGADLFSRAASRQVSSARVSLTTVFGMGTGGPSS